MSLAEKLLREQISEMRQAYAAGARAPVSLYSPLHAAPAAAAATAVVFTPSASSSAAAAKQQNEKKKNSKSEPMKHDLITDWDDFGHDLPGLRSEVTQTQAYIATKATLKRDTDPLPLPSFIPPPLRRSNMAEVADRAVMSHISSPEEIATRATRRVARRVPLATNGSSKGREDEKKKQKDTAKAGWAVTGQTLHYFTGNTAIAVGRSLFSGPFERQSDANSAYEIMRESMGQTYRDSAVEAGRMLREALKAEGDAISTKRHVYTTTSCRVREVTDKERLAMRKDEAHLRPNFVLLRRVALGSRFVVPFDATECNFSTTDVKGMPKRQFVSAAASAAARLKSDAAMQTGTQDMYCASCGKVHVLPIFDTLGNEYEDVSTTFCAGVTTAAAAASADYENYLPAPKIVPVMAFDVAAAPKPKPLALLPPPHPAPSIMSFMAHLALPPPSPSTPLSSMPPAVPASAPAKMSLLGDD